MTALLTALSLVSILGVCLYLIGLSRGKKNERLRLYKKQISQFMRSFKRLKKRDALLRDSDFVKRLRAKFKR